jgi:hypothetical protein
MCGDNRGKYTNIGEKYFEEFNTHFWHRPGNKGMFTWFTYVYLIYS